MEPSASSGQEVWGPQGRIDIRNDRLTLIGHPRVVLRGTWFQIQANEVIFDGVNIGLGDADPLSYDDADPISIGVWRPSGPSEHFRNIVIRNSTLVWGPDIGGIAIFAGTRDVTVQDNVICCGLRLSRHSEGVEAQGGHAFSMNIASGDTQYGPVNRVTVARNLIGRSDGRNPKITGGNQVEIVNNIIWSWDRRPAEGVGTQNGIHVVNNWYSPGPSDTLAAWRPRLNGNWPWANGTVWVNGNQRDGGGAFDISLAPQDQLASGPLFTPSHTPMSATAARAHVLANAGDGGAFAQRFLSDYAAGIIVRFNGVGHPPPNPSW